MVAINNHLIVAQLLATISGVSYQMHLRAALDRNAEWNK